MTQEELNEISEKHRKWLNGEDGGERANLRSANLSYANLSYANLRSANLRGADLRGADLSYADLRSVNLHSADLSGADLRSVNLRYAGLRYANLSDANLSDANLSRANLSDANLSRADLSYANLYGADLDENEKIRLGVCLEEPMVGYKKCENGVIVTLKIPEGAIVFSINNSKCRANMAKVIDIDNGLTKATSCYDPKFIYRKGRIVRVKNFNCQYNEECASGIHFFRSRKEAEEY